MISLGLMLNFFFMLFMLRWLLVMVLISVMCLLISCVMFLLLVEIIIGWLVVVLLCVRVLIMLLVLIFFMYSSGRLRVWMLVCSGLIWICRLLGIDGWLVLYLVNSLLWKVGFLVLKIIVNGLFGYCLCRFRSMFSMFFIVLVGLLVEVVSGGRVWKVWYRYEELFIRMRGVWFMRGINFFWRLGCVE